MKRNGLIPAASIVDRLCRNLRYSRSHIAKILRDNARKLRARRVDRRWMIPVGSEHALRDLVIRTSGRRYKLGEKGPHGR